jgi:hypothetical protein
VTWQYCAAYLPDFSISFPLNSSFEYRHTDSRHAGFILASGKSNAHSLGVFFNDWIPGQARNDDFRIDTPLLPIEVF